ncbi:MAG: putative enoyl-CoA hydratase echA8 [Firmicutes bacterium ADurb.Bin182]|nr:MAG: putative enoyl-CoA hydratase echA8 [Firmicutes bacterium ADurb.Bin182]
MQYVRLEKHDNIALLTIDRPKAYNALNIAVLFELKDAAEAFASDDEALVLVITGGGKAFVAGADISEMLNFGFDEAKDFARLGCSVFDYIERLEKPSIAAVNGFALGGGCELALCCDIRIAGESAKFGQPEVTLGITPGFGGTQRLPRAVGTANAIELILTGRTVTAQEALQMGLVGKVVPDESLLDTALGIARSIAANAPCAIRRCKTLAQRWMKRYLEEDIEFENELFASCFETEDQKNAMSAFLQKRKVERFLGR